MFNSVFQLRHFQIYVCLRIFRLSQRCRSTRLNSRKQEKRRLYLCSLQRFRSVTILIFFFSEQANLKPLIITLSCCSEMKGRKVLCFIILRFKTSFKTATYIQMFAFLGLLTCTCITYSVYHTRLFWLSGICKCVLGGFYHASTVHTVPKIHLKV